MQDTPPKLYYFAALANVVSHVKLEALTRCVAAKMAESFQAQNPANLHCSIGNFTAEQLENIAPELAPSKTAAMADGQIVALPANAHDPATADQPLLFRVFRNMETKELSLAVCFRHPVFEGWQEDSGLNRPMLHVTLGRLVLDDDAGKNLTELNADLREGNGLFAGVPELLQPLQKDHVNGNGLGFDRAYIAPAIAKLRQETVSRVALFTGAHASHSR